MAGSERLERLINLVAALLHADRPVPRERLREEVPGYPPDEVSFRRSFERDKEALRGMGIPLALEPVDPSDPDGLQGYRIPPEDYQLPDPGLDAEELAALSVAASAVRVEGAEGTSGLWKLGGAIAAEGGALPTAALPGSEHLPVLFGAVLERRTVTFPFRGGERRVDPYSLAFRNGRWYLGGWDHDREAERSFRLDRLDGPPAAGPARAFARPASSSLGPVHPWRAGDEEEVEATVLVDADQAGWAVREVGEDAVVERRDDGSVVLRLAVTNRAAFRSFVLNFLHHAEVLGPPELRDDLVRWLHAISA